MLYRAKTDKDLGVKGCKIIGNDIPLGYELVEIYFVDNSGFGCDDELALTFDKFLDKIKVGRFYGIREVGQFQVYIGEFKKVNNDLGIANSKLISKGQILDFKDGLELKRA